MRITGPADPAAQAPAPRAEPTPLRWLDLAPSPGTLVTWGVPWPNGALPDGSPFALHAGDEEVPLQSWTTATWPDGSVKWSAHAAVLDGPAAPTLVPGQEASAPAVPVTVAEGVTEIVVDTGRLVARIPLSGSVIVSSLEVGDAVVARDGRLVSELARDPEGRERAAYVGVVEGVRVESAGPVRVVVLVTGRHANGERRWLPFRVRLYFAAGSDRVRMVHTMIWDGDPETDFLAALGVRFDVPLTAPLHDRHVRIAGSAGFLTEAARPVTGLWRDPGQEVRDAQVRGRATPPAARWRPTVSDIPPPFEWADRLRHVPAWTDFTLAQLSPDGYTLRKRTGADHGWVGAPSGTRARGYAYLGQPAGGLELGLRGFWQSYPTQIDIRGATTDLGSLTMWLWSPLAPPMDLRYYHAGTHEQDHDGQRRALELTYEDHQPGLGSAHGVARTHELSLRAADATPTAELLEQRARENADPPVLLCSPARIRSARVFGDWSLPDRTHPRAAQIEDRLDLLVDYYAGQVDQRRWYGFWDYGDVMHSYDRDRETWRYDIGGYAWDNSELSTDAWLWTHFLRTGQARAYRLAEAMTRHTGEVDVYHVGPQAGFGTRHNVQHWGCACKQLRVSNALYRRYLYYLSADERIGDLLDEVAITDATFVTLDRNRMLGARAGERPLDPSRLEVDLGIDYGAILAGWLTRWERSGDPAARRRIVETLTAIGRMPRGYFTGVGHFDLVSGTFDAAEEGFAVSHLSAVFGLVEVLAEILELLELSEFEATWLDYCTLYLAPPQEQRGRLGVAFDRSLKLPHSRLLAWAAHRTGDAELARRAWHVFLRGPGDRANLNDLDPASAIRDATGPGVAEPVSVIPAVTTNDAAQYGLAAIQNLALIGRHLPGPGTWGSVSDQPA